MKKFLLIFSLATCALYGQLNPVKKVTFNQWYVNPQNCYILHWTPPDPSLTDTLIGYNVYRDDSLYKFTTDTTQQYIPCLGDTSSADAYFLWYSPVPFYIHVNAVYNSSHLESSYADSAQCIGQMIGIKNIGYTALSISPNPFSEETVISVAMPLKSAILLVEDYTGQVVKQVRDVCCKSFRLQCRDLPKGIYTVRITQDNRLISISKIVIGGD